MTDLVLLAAIPNWVKPLAYIIPGALGVLLVMWLVYLLLTAVAPKVAAIAWTTAREGWSQLLFWVALAFGAVVLAAFLFVPYHTFGEDIKMVKDSGLSVMTILSIVVALWTASVSIAEEIEGRTALTLLSKPVGRRQFVIGKFLGILTPVAVMFVILAIVYLGGISYKVVYDARETSLPAPEAKQCLEEVGKTVPGMVLAFFETIVLTSISVAFATRLPMVPNLILCAVIYGVGHFVPLLAQSAVGQFEIVGFIAQLLAVVFPVLEHFNAQASVATGQMVPFSVVGWAALYTLLYSLFALVGALFLFEERDLA